MAYKLARYNSLKTMYHLVDGETPTAPHTGVLCNEKLRVLVLDEYFTYPLGEDIDISVFVDHTRNETLLQQRRLCSKCYTLAQHRFWDTTKLEPGEKRTQPYEY